MARQATKASASTISTIGGATTSRDDDKLILGQTGGAGGSPPDDPMLEKRVESLETDMKDVKASLARLEVSFARFEEKLNGIVITMATKEDLVRLELATKQQISDLELKTKQEFARIELSTKQEFARLEKDVAEIKGKISQIPTTWQIVAIIATLMISLSGLFYTANNAANLFQKTPTAVVAPVNSPPSQLSPAK